MFQRRNSSLLDLEAANYFEIDPDQMHLLNMKSYQSNRSKEIKSKDKNSLALAAPISSSAYETPKMRARNSSRSPQKVAQHNHKPLSQESGKIVVKAQGNEAGRSKTTKRDEINQIEPSTPSLSIAYFRAQKSPSTSTCSLPSISSSPSLSPSLVCPHLSLDDILSRHEDGRSRSAHTIGLCEKCLVCPPPNIHSPLSPAFRPSVSKLQVPQLSSSSTQVSHNSNKSSQKLDEDKMYLRRGYSDQQVGARASRNMRSRLPQDDSLDCYLEPDDLKRLQMSPTVRHSVGYIRNNTTEAGRVVRIYKNGSPFDKPLRICIMRGEFSNLNHLLDHINSRQLIASGARYLFHLDGQLVYSENELKHGSCYIVSGTRNFDFKLNRVLKEQQMRRDKLDSKQPIIQQAPTFNQKEYRIRSQPQQQVAGNNDPPFREAAIDQAQRRVSPSNRIVTNVAPIKNSILGRQDQMPATKKSCSNRWIESTPRNPLNQRPTTKNATKQMVIRKPASREVKKKFNNKQELVQRMPQDAPVTRSNENLDSMMSSVEQQPKSVVRAKSELSTLPRNKRKKNVTFVDTGRGSSPAINLQTEDEIDAVNHLDGVRKGISTNDELETNDIGIQVSDSIEGFLIDLPIALPRDGSDKKREPVHKTTGRQKPPVRRKHGKIITITERQLSFDEMGKLKDMDAGDHHNEAHKIQHVSIRLDSVDSKEGSVEGEPEPVEVVVPDRTDTINIGQELPVENQNKSVEKSVTNSDNWQYPEDLERPGRSSTPTERPISQSDANETVHARVTTPSPSLSTMGDSNSLAISYDYCQYQRDDEAAAAAMAKLPDKKRLQVIGTLRQGVDLPVKNFKLVWVNGFIINDQYPENSITASSMVAQSSAHRSTESKSPVVGLLSPSTNDERCLPMSHFKPSDRFHNWVCHSRRHDELIYPTGSLVILYCRWTNEQRYYSRHTSNVSAITLASLDDDLAASAQLGDPQDRTNNCAIHLWSLSTLETLRVVEDDSFRNRHIFSLKVRNTESDGCELSICGREEKRLWFYVFFLRLDTDSKIKQSSSPKRGGQIAIKFNKPLQANQIPLMLARLSNVRGEQPKKSSSKRKSSLSATQTDLFGNIMVSFGRRHFHVWFVDRLRQSLIPMQAMNKSSYFVETIVRANCFVRMSPSEFLVGDSAGNVGLLSMQIHHFSDPKSLISSTTRLTNYKYSIDAWPLNEGTNASSLNAEPIATRNPITCLTRITGSLFVAADSNCAIRFWKIIRSGGKHSEEQEAPKDSSQGRLDCKCQQLGCIRLPRDLGFICSIILAKYNRKQPTTVEFYALSTSNTILFGSVQLQTGVESIGNPLQDRAPLNCSLSVIYEGHESPAMSLVADPLPLTTRRAQNKALMDDTSEGASQIGNYFTCSLDYKICKWSGKNLVWKSMLPSACASIAVHPIGFVLATGSADGTVYILDKISGLLISYFPLTPVCINCLAYSRDGTLLAAGCVNGSIFILPVYERGLKYKKVSILQSPHPVVSLQFSVNNKYILTAVTHDSYQELILWDLPNFRYMRNNVELTADKIEWFDSICSGSEDVRAIWENANLDIATNGISTARSKYQARKLSLPGYEPIRTNTIVNLSCHRLIRRKQQNSSGEMSAENFVIASDTRGHLRLFRYPCSNIQQGFYEVRVGSSAVSCCRFLAIHDRTPIDDAMFVSSSLDGSICLWSLC